MISLHALEAWREGDLAADLPRPARRDDATTGGRLLVLAIVEQAVKDVELCKEFGYIRDGRVVNFKTSEKTRTGGRWTPDDVAQLVAWFTDGWAQRMLDLAGVGHADRIIARLGLRADERRKR